MWFKKCIMKSRWLVFCLVMVIVPLHPGMVTAGDINAEERNLEKQAEEYIDIAYSEMNIPGMSVIIVQEDRISIINKGFESSNGDMKVTDGTLFELASISKAFTALGILYLEKKQMIDLEDPVIKYVPDLYIQDAKEPLHNGAEKIKIRHLLDHTSGIPFLAMTRLSPGEGNDALKETAVLLKDFKLESAPGEEYLYSSINYDLLGLIIEIATEQSYEQFMLQYIMEPLGFKRTCILNEKLKESGEVCRGHKYSYFRPVEYDAPFYRGNAPAAYIVSSAEDMAQWLKIQMGFADVPVFYKEIVSKSHNPNKELMISLDTYYGFGWEADIKQDYIKHSGLNPNFSAGIYISLKSGIGVCILSNVNTTNLINIAQNLVNIYEDKQITSLPLDMMAALDKGISIMIVLFSLIILLFLILIIRSPGLMKRNRYKRKHRGKSGFAIFVFSGGLLIFCVYQLYTFPGRLSSGLNWEVIEVWGPAGISGAIWLFGVLLSVMWIYTMLAFYYGRRKNKKNIAIMVSG